MHQTYAQIRKFAKKIMEFLKNIYFNALQICVTNAIGTAVASKDATVFYCLPNTTPNELKSFIFEQESKARLCFIIAKDWDQILDTLKAIFIFIEAGGGAVFNENKELLCIYRRGVWDLPKGKLDDGELIDACALREVEEETNVSGLQLGALLLETWHVYEMKGKWFLKKTTWFKMNTAYKAQLIPQAIEQIEAVEWVPMKKIPAYINEQSFGTLQEVISALQ
jgi:8-oxo-dGTP pyrophosphatase MutT (NUDIX family)